MTDRVLTDHEIVGLSLDLASVLGAGAFVKTVRDIESAVLAKLNRKEKPVPRIVRLSTGLLVRKCADADGFEYSATGGVSWWGRGALSFVVAKTVEDARVLIGLVEQPYE